MMNLKFELDPEFLFAYKAALNQLFVAVVKYWRQLRGLLSPQFGTIRDLILHLAQFW